MVCFTRLVEGLHVCTESTQMQTRMKQQTQKRKLDEQLGLRVLVLGLTRPLQATNAGHERSHITLLLESSTSL